jgi:antibiotic biosynthesis monooxygenase (ABM) superfamily enzyme
MLEFLRVLRQQGDLLVRLPGLPLAFIIAELFFKFHSFTLECAAFLLTWLVIDVVVATAARWLRRPRAQASR